MAELKITIPNAPALLPGPMQKKWKAVYEAAFNDAKAAGEGKESDWHQSARCEANRLLRVAEPKSYEEAMALPAWQVTVQGKDTRAVKDGVLKLVTIDGRKYRFDVPQGKDKTETPANA